MLAALLLLYYSIVATEGHANAMFDCRRTSQYEISKDCLLISGSWLDFCEIETNLISSNQSWRSTSKKTYLASFKQNFIVHWTSLNHKSDQSWVQSGVSDHGFVSMFKSQSLCPSSKVAPLTEHKHDNSWRKSQLILRSNQYPLEKQAC